MLVHVPEVEHCLRVDLMLGVPVGLRRSFVVLLGPLSQKTHRKKKKKKKLNEIVNSWLIKLGQRLLHSC